MATSTRKTATVTLDSTSLDPIVLEEIETIIYGSPDNPPRLPLPAEIVAIIKRETLVEDPKDPGTYYSHRQAFIEDPNDPGTFFIEFDNIAEDPDDPGTYLIGAL